MAIALAQMPDWPAAMDWPTALAYLGIADATLRGYAQQGRVRFLATGPNGKRMARRVQLDELLVEIFTNTPTSIGEDFNFGDR
ncbi:MAG: hypothetical protein ACRYG4_08770 [Janthinobacterium lividum]